MIVAPPIKYVIVWPWGQRRRHHIQVGGGGLYVANLLHICSLSSNAYGPEREQKELAQAQNSTKLRARK